ncbi:sugar phosphate isomerase/epimerase family protein [Moritella dasanensis]|uniref:sugar phosphate isomerase/epimerase family protein n=1 Tax=Moritella dasanensis TaxID=428031 RepID=UPI0002E5D3CC|nr:sugar phosphate isomerase/epimerase [Moritella dasanensis]
MKLSISNIAWEISIDEDVAAVLNKYQVDAIDVAPPKYFPRVSDASESDIQLIKKYWEDKNISIIGMQSLLFGTQGLNVFGSAKSQSLMLEHLSHICHIGKLLGAIKLVFGSPRNRDRSGFDDEEARGIAKDFFVRLGDIAKEHGVIICLEPNPICYNANFMVNSLETASMVELINHSNIKMQLDVGAMMINDEDPEVIIPKIAHLVGHIHISEPQLASINIDNKYHHVVSLLLRQYLPDKDITIEMLTSNQNSSLDEIEQSIKFVSETYMKKTSQ